MRKIRSRLTYANVIATLALFIAIGGSAYAATQLKKNSVGTKQIKNQAVTAAKIQNGAITGAQVKGGSLSGSNVANNSLTGTQINSSTLGKVPTAQTADTAQTAQTAQTANSLSAPEAWHEVGASGQPQFQHGCTSSGGEDGPVKFFKDHEGVVHLAGVYENCSPTAETAFQLPAGFRPGAVEQFPLAGAGEGRAVAIFPSIAEVPTISGAVACGGTTCYLNGITFRAES